MVDAHLSVSQQNVARVSEGTPVLSRGTRDGSMVTVPWYLSLVLEGRVFGVNMGSATSAFDSDTGGSTPAFDDDQPTFGLDIPDNTVVMPLEIIYQCETHTGTTEGFIEMFVGFAPAPTALGAATSTPLTSANMRIGSGITSNCTARGPYTADVSPDAITTTTGYGEFFRSGYPDDADVANVPGDLSAVGANIATHYEWSALTGGVPPIIVGPAVLVAYVSSSSNDGVLTGYFTATWAELPESAIR